MQFLNIKKQFLKPKSERNFSENKILRRKGVDCVFLSRVLQILGDAKADETEIRPIWTIGAEKTRIPRIAKSYFGQTGADRAGLDAAKSVGLQTGGTAPKGWKTENGSDLSLKQLGLQEALTSEYPPRTKMNVDNADATIVFRLHPGKGTEKTIGYAQTHTWCAKTESLDSGYRPVLVLSSFDASDVETACNFLARNKVRVLNVAGHRESTAGIEHFAQTVQQFLETVFKTHLASFKSE